MLVKGKFERFRTYQKYKAQAKNGNVKKWLEKSKNLINSDNEAYFYTLFCILFKIRQKGREKMILKYKTTTRDTKEERWNYIDGIVGASTFLKDGVVCVEIEKEDRSSCTLAVYEETFLLNDSGRTIEKVKV